MNDKLSQATAEIAEWNTRIWKLREDIAKAETVLAESQHRRQSHVLEAALGDEGAKQRLEQVLADDRKAERELADLKMALPLAESRLREAENEHRNIEIEMRNHEKNRLVLERIEAAKEVDRALADVAAALQRYLDIGADIWPLVVDPYGSTRDQIEGWMRIAKALPAPFQILQKRLPGVDFGGGGPLAQAEASYWNVSIIKKDAA
jgi:hypothetical protein